MTVPFMKSNILVYRRLCRPGSRVALREEPGSATSRTADASQLRMRPYG